jgi:hypothetical protein
MVRHDYDENNRWKLTSITRVTKGCYVGQEVVIDRASGHLAETCGSR